MTVFLVSILVAVLVALVIDRFLTEAAHRRERERLMRAVLARHLPEMAALQKVFEPDGQPRRLRAVGAERDPAQPPVPEGM